MLELKFQTEILKAVKDCGGFGNKISDRFKIGVPDLLVACSGKLVLLELKSMGEVPDKFSRKTGVTAIQQETLRRYNQTAILPVAAQLIFLNHRGEARAVVWPAEWDTISNSYEEREELWTTRQKKEPRWDMEKLVHSVALTLYLLKEAELTATS